MKNITFFKKGHIFENWEHFSKRETFLKKDTFLKRATGDQGPGPGTGTGTRDQGPGSIAYRSLSEALPSLSGRCQVFLGIRDIPVADIPYRNLAKLSWRSIRTFFFVKKRTCFAWAKGPKREAQIGNQ